MKGSDNAAPPIEKYKTNSHLMPASSLFPFRTELHAASPEEIREANERGGLSGKAQEFLSLTEETKKFDEREIRLKQPLFKHEHCILYAHHPDERVLVELISRESLRGTYWYFFQNVYFRSRQPAHWQALGLPEDYSAPSVGARSGDPSTLSPDSTAPSWDPLLDAIDSAEQWPGKAVVSHPVHFASGKFHTGARPVAEMLTGDERLLAWLQSRPSVEEWMSLKAFKAPRFFAALATLAPEIPEEVLPHLFTHPESLSALLFRDSPEPHIVRFVREESERLVKLDAEGLSLEPVFKKAYHAPLVHKLLCSLRTPEFPLQEETRTELRERVLMHLRMENRMPGGNVLEMWDTYASDPAIPLSEMKRVYRQTRGLPMEARLFMLKSLINSPSATPELWQIILEDQRSTRVRALLAAHPEASRQSEIRSRLLKSSDSDILFGLALSAEADEFTALFGRLVEGGANLGKAAQLLDRTGDNQLRTLHAADLAPLLSSSEQSIRLSAIRALPRLAHSGEAQATVQREGEREGERERERSTGTFFSRNANY